MNYNMNRLPLEIENEIISFLIPDKTKITYRKNIKGHSSSYDGKYDAAFINGDVIKNSQGHYLTRIAKENGKHRYYITREIIDCIEVEHNDRPFNIYHYDYVSKYIGKNIEHTLLLLLASNKSPLADKTEKYNNDGECWYDHW